MIIRNWHIGEVVSFSVAHCATIESPQDFLHSETHPMCWLSVTALRSACTVLLISL